MVSIKDYTIIIPCIKYTDVEKCIKKSCCGGNKKQPAWQDGIFIYKLDYKVVGKGVVMIKEAAHLLVNGG